ncbi:AMP-binding protein [Microbacterium terrisoli]|uniref:AMP-binding protein n=1 Tax=Microbacterium terrisoli TaxID=3242192 RepID=UPI0028040D7B|nr:AMP-binding protein [Microbacterium protaetiae]
MRLEPLAGDATAVLAAARRMLEGTGPALALGMTGGMPTDVPDGTAVEVPEGTAAVITTSGSTGVPKSVVLSRAALLAGTDATAARIGQGAWLLALPPGYIAGLQVMIRSLRAGCDPILLEGRFDPVAFAEAALAMPPGSYTSLVPAQLQRLLDAAEADDLVAEALRTFAAILVGGQALPLATRERAQDAGARIVRTYGSTETCGGCVYDGVPLQDVRAAIVDGEVRLSGPMLADGYLGDPQLTDAVFVTDDDGRRWYRTGDAGVIDDGVLRIHGRIDNVIVSGGVNVSLDRVERVVRDVAGLAGAVVVGVPDQHWGEASVIVVPRGQALRRSDSAQLDAARQAVADQLGAAARPARLVLVDRLATLPSGKPDREAIRRAVADA